MNESMVSESLAELGVPRLRRLVLSGADTVLKADLLHDDLKRFIQQNRALESIVLEVDLRPIGWKTVERQIEKICRTIDGFSSRLQLWTIHSTSLPHAIPDLSIPKAKQDDPTYCIGVENFTKISFAVTPQSEKPAYRATRTILPRVEELHIELMGNTTDSDVLQWYFDGMDMPRLQQLTVVIGSHVELLRPVIASLLLLPTSCALRITDATRIAYAEWERRKKARRLFLKSKEYVDLKE